ncbi:13264_t:CDS:2 [Funneliformis caledonium]|uniref:13264_t:CDS:1 n=1 Tax=Funneliformis caledonium TaxID=1117310 RepID=A0A9N8Z453_9GLOM|nr:13264_t:CDS:2 [Funneliformis caledonium]
MSYQSREPDLTLAVLEETENDSKSVFGKCLDCGKERIGDGWCKDCESNAFKENFGNWTSENTNIDDFIRSTQLNANGSVEYLEYINFEQFDLIENTNKGGAFSTTCSAVWMEGPRWIWDEMADQWIRNGPIKVALKRLNNSQNISADYLNQIYKYHQCENVADFFGITKDHTLNYMFVMKYESNSLNSYLDETQGMLCWKDIEAG